MSTENEPGPELEDVQQQEPEDVRPAPPVPVVVDGVVRVAFVPARTASMRRLNLTDVPEVIASEDRRRARVLLRATSGTNAFYVGTDRTLVMNGDAARYNSGVDGLEFFTYERLWARAASGASVCELSVVIENWAD
jgi:hypothetical protein